MKNYLYILFFIIGLLLVADNTFAQCAMCKAVIESNPDDVGKGINNAILYIMVMPYILLGIIAFVFYKKKTSSKLSK
jgi:hypothetical protein